MAANRIMRGGAVRRGLALALACVAIAAALAGCGGGEDGGATAAAPGRAADAVILNRILSRQEAAVGAYRDAMPWLRRGPLLKLARRFRAQEEEHVDATINALRRLGEAADPQPEEIRPGKLRSQTDALTFLYQLEAGTIGAVNGAIGALTTPAARMLLAATMANQAQHLVWLRRALGAKPLATFPEAFEDGSVAAP